MLPHTTENKNPFTSHRIRFQIEILRFFVCFARKLCVENGHCLAGGENKRSKNEIDDHEGKEKRLSETYLFPRTLLYLLSSDPVDCFFDLILFPLHYLPLPSLALICCLPDSLLVRFWFLYHFFCYICVFVLIMFSLYAFSLMRRFPLLCTFLVSFLHFSSVRLL